MPLVTQGKVVLGERPDKVWFKKALLMIDTKVKYTLPGGVLGPTLEPGLWKASAVECLVARPLPMGFGRLARKRYIGPFSSGPSTTGEDIGVRCYVDRVVVTGRGIGG